jgi:4-hydroxy-tetrahydrodipicolinate reductase
VTRVAVAGALGRMGRVACNALRQTADVTYAGGLARTELPDEQIYNDFEALLAVGRPDVLLDLTTYPDSVQISMNALAHGVRPVVGATGWRNDEYDALNRLALDRGLGAMIVPNFSIGAVLMMKFADQAARYFPSAEVIELHHDKKKDAPSGTAKLTAQRISLAGGPKDVPIHSVRMKGLIAHQEVLFGIDGELLTIRHDTLSRDSFAPGMLAAVRRVMTIRGLQVGLDA